MFGQVLASLVAGVGKAGEDLPGVLASFLNLLPQLKLAGDGLEIIGARFEHRKGMFS